MRSTNTTSIDNNARESHSRVQHPQSALANVAACCTSEKMQHLNRRAAKRKSYDRGKKVKIITAPTAKTSISHSTSLQQHMQYVLQQQCIAAALRLIRHTAFRLGKCRWWLRSDQVIIPASYQQKQQTYCAMIIKSEKTKTTTASHISSSNCHTHTAPYRPLTRTPLPSLVLRILLVLLLLWVLGFSCLIGSACAAPQSCVLCDISDFKKQQESNAQTSYEVYQFEHQVTRVDAIAALKTFNVSDYGEPSGCAISCSEKVMKYCLGPQFINDHCWCELGHTEEGLPFIPHVCYVGDKLYKAAVGSCYFYEQVKECCCAPALAKQWRHISVASRQISAGSLLLLSILPIFFNAARR